MLESAWSTSLKMCVEHFSIFIDVLSWQVCRMCVFNVLVIMSYIGGAKC